MLKNYFKIAYRNLLKNKVFSLINIVGLALGMMSFLFILQYVQFELSYDDFHANATEIYRVRSDRYVDGVLQYEKATAFIPTGKAMKEEFPEVLNYTTLWKISADANIVVSFQPAKGQKKSFNEERIFHAKGDFFKVFSFPIVLGDPTIAALAPGTVLISQSMANKYFNEEQPLGEILHHSIFGDYIVAGVFADLPQNSHLQIDFLFAWEQVTSDRHGGDMNNWSWDGFFTYLTLSPNSDILNLESKFPAFIKKYMGNRRLHRVDTEFHLQPLTDIHLNSHFIGEAEINGNGKVVYILMIIKHFLFG